MSFPRYPAYKDSGVEWLGKVPEHWHVAPFKRYIERNDGGVWGDDPTGERDTIVLRSTEQTVDGRWAIDDPAPRHLTPAEKESALLSAGDLLVTKSSGSALHIGKTTLVTDEVAAMQCCYSNFMQRLRTTPEFTPALGWWLMNSPVARLQFDLLSNSTTGLANLNGTIIGQMMIAVPPPAEQAAIVAFLDRETAKIDALISEQERLIELLKEKRQAVISHAVTKGLDPDVPMKDSGVEWLGEVPAHWEVKPLRYCIDYSEGPGIMASEFRDEGVPLLRVAGVQERWASLDGCNFLDPALVDRRWSHFRLEAGDLLISGSASMGLVCEVGPNAAGAIPYTGLIRLRGIDGVMTRDFIRATVISHAFFSQIDLLKAGATIQHFGPTHLSQMRLACPPVLEQVAITTYVDEVTSQIDDLIVTADSATALLQERRAALISAAVTGQIDVRDAAPAR